MSSSSPLSCGGMMNLNTDGAVMSNEEVLRQRARKGLCQTCQNEPVQCFKIKRHPLIPLKTIKEPLTIEGRVNKGICLRCFPAMDPQRKRERERQRRRQKPRVKETTNDSTGETTDYNSLPVASCRYTDSSTTCTSSSDGSSAITETTIATGELSSSVSSSHTNGEIGSITTTITVDDDSSTHDERQPTSSLSADGSSIRRTRNDALHKGLDRQKGLRDIRLSASGNFSEERSDRQNDDAAPLHANESSGRNPPTSSKSPGHSSRHSAMTDGDANDRNSTHYYTWPEKQRAAADLRASPAASASSSSGRESRKSRKEEREGSLVNHAKNSCSSLETLNDDELSAVLAQIELLEKGEGQEQGRHSSAVVSPQAKELGCIIDDLLDVDGDATAIEVLCSAMEASDDVQVLEYGITTLWSLGRKKEENKNTIMDSSCALDSILDAMKRYLSSPSIQERGCGVIWSLSVTKKIRPEVVRRGGCDQVVTAFVEHIHNESVVKMAMGALRIMSTVKEAKEIMKNRGISGVFAQAMASHRQSEKVQLEGSALLCNLAVDVVHSTVDDFSKEEIEAVIKAMEAHSHSCAVQKNVCFTLKNITFSEKNVDILSQIPISSTIIKSAATNFPEQCDENAKIILARLDEAIMAAKLVEESAYAALNQVTLTSASDEDAIDSIVSMMVEHSQSLKVQGGGLQALWTISRKSSVSRSKMARSDVLREIMSAMTRHPDSSDLQEKGCGVLGSIASADTKARKEIIRAGGVGAIVDAMRFHHGEESVQVSAFTALNALSVEPDCRVAVERKEGALAAINEALIAHADSQTVQIEGVEALIRITSDSHQFDRFCFGD